MSFSYVLPDEILIIIFNFCNEYHTLLQFSMVCKQFYRVSREILDKRSKHLLVTNQTSKKFCERCKPLLLSTISKYITHHNWKNGKCKNREIYKGKNICVSSRKCLQMTKNRIWFLCDNNLFAYNRAKDGTIKNYISTSTKTTHIRTITHCNDEIISGDVYGNIRRWRIEESQDKTNYLTYSKIHNVQETINEIDATSQHIITASMKSIKILKYTDDKDGCTKKNQISFRWEPQNTSISFDPTETKFAASFDFDTLYIPYKSSFLLYDIDKCYPIIDKIPLGLCTKLLWEDPHTILMCYDSFIKKMDIRTSKFVHTWNASPAVNGYLTCLSSDNLYTFITGNTKAILWDQRKSVPIQTYQVGNNETINMGICYLEFDSAHMYVAKWNSLSELDFTGKNHFDYNK